MSPSRLHRRVILVGLVMTTLTVVVNAVRFVTTGDLRPVRMAVHLAIVAVAVVELRGEARLWLVSRIVAVILAMLSFADVLLPADLGGAPPGVMVGMLVVLAAFDAALTANDARDRAPLVALLSAVYAGLTGVVERLPMFDMVGRLIVGAVGPLATWALVMSLVRSLRSAVERAERQSAVDAALARCSSLLLSQVSESAIPDAIRELLYATSAGYVFVDVNGVDEEGRATWTIVHSAERDGVPGPGLFGSGTYEDIPWVLEALSAGRHAVVDVADLPPGGSRRSYEREGVTIELVVPVVVNGRWFGSLGLTDFGPRRRWHDDEIRLVTRAAEMIGAHLSQRSATEGLAEINEAKTRFLAAVAHELRTPLSAVLGFAAELADRPELIGEREARDIADLIRQQAGELADLVADLVAVERAASGALTLLPETLSLTQQVHRAVEGLADGRLAVVGEEGEAFADPVHVRQIIRNLVSNAVRHGGETIVIEVHASPGGARIVVRDDGSGIDPLDVDAMFEEFAHHGRGDTRPGTVGLGLAVARRLARLMGGDIAYSRADGWTRFSLLLPTGGSVTEPEKADHDPVHERLPGGLDDVLVDADRAPGTTGV